jgi:DNA-binding NarL/FixJ family response regulator
VDFFDLKSTTHSNLGAILMENVMRRSDSSVDVLIVALPSRFRDGLKTIVQALTWVERVGVVPGWTAVFDYVQHYQPAIVIFDVADLNLLTAEDANCLCQAYQQAKSIAIIDRAQQREVAHAVGANAILLRGFTTELLYHTMRTLVVAYDPAVPVTGPLKR